MRYSNKVDFRIPDFDPREYDPEDMIDRVQMSYHERSIDGDISSIIGLAEKRGPDRSQLMQQIPSHQAAPCHTHFYLQCCHRTSNQARAERSSQSFKAL